MDHTITSHSKILLFFMTISLLLISQSTTAQTPDCGSNTTTFGNNSQFQANLNTLLGYLSSNATNPNGYHQAVSSDDNSRNEVIYGHFLCHGDLNNSACQDCVTTATIELPTRYCANRKDALIWYEKCLLRYSNQSFFNKSDESLILYLWNRKQILGNTSRFEELVRNMLNNEIADQAALGGSQKKFATNLANYTRFQTIYGLGQCTPDLSGSDCNSCLLTAIYRFNFSYEGGRVLQPSCEVRYEIYPFFNLSSLPLPPQPSPQPPQQAPTDTTNSNGKRKTSITIAVGTVVPIVILGLLIALCTYHYYRKKQKKYLSRDMRRVLKDFTTAESLMFDLETLQVATNHFSDDQKLGGGGFGDVYKGTLLDGEEIAVKRLSRISNQGMEAFKNEAVLIAKLQHKNLVRLLGFCIAGEERLLVYEFVRNKSLDYYLFDPTKQGELDWSTRYNIIIGIARGLLYLHEDSRPRIIHRDLKAGNILLEGDMNPKISDFGLARILKVELTVDDTSFISGTYGYMAPEYAMNGQFSMKSDVYSLGVVLLEIVSGKRINCSFESFGEDGDLLTHAWKSWKDEKPLEFMDPTLGDSCSSDEVLRCIHLGLACAQENANNRPTMSTVVFMLNTNSAITTLPPPPCPRFFYYSSSDTSHVTSCNQNSASSRPTSSNAIL